MASYSTLTLHGGPRDGETVRYLGTPPVLVTAETLPAPPEVVLVPIRYHEYLRRPGSRDYDYRVPTPAPAKVDR